MWMFTIGLVFGIALAIGMSLFVAWLVMKVDEWVDI
jgi:hypothetical protein